MPGSGAVRGERDAERAGYVGLTVVPPTRPDELLMAVVFEQGDGWGDAQSQEQDALPRTARAPVAAEIAYRF